MTRRARAERSTKESQVEVVLDLDGSGTTDVDTGVPFFDHMLAQLGKHALFDLAVHAKGDVEVDAHHTVEDVSIVLGQALREALGDKAGITRFGDALVPLDETLVQVAVDVSGRPYCVHEEPGIVELIGGTRSGRPNSACTARVSVASFICRSGCFPAATPTTWSRRSSRRWHGRFAPRCRSTPVPQACRRRRVSCDRSGGGARLRLRQPPVGRAGAGASRGGCHGHRRCCRRQR